jgi:hypothetical protein
MIEASVNDVFANFFRFMNRSYTHFFCFMKRKKLLVSRVITLVPICAMTGLGANGEIRPENCFQKVSILDTSYLSQKWWRYCNGVQPHVP